MSAWIKASERLPSKEQFGPYPTVWVAMACATARDLGYRVRVAELRYFGQDPLRPYWCSTQKRDDLAAIENDCWFVEYWQPLPSPPAPYKEKES